MKHLVSHFSTFLLSIISMQVNIGGKILQKLNSFKAFLESGKFKNSFVFFAFSISEKNNTNWKCDFFEGAGASKILFPFLIAQQFDTLHTLIQVQIEVNCSLYKKEN